MTYLDYTVKIELCLDAMYRCIDSGSNMRYVWEAQAAKLKVKRSTILSKSIQQ